MSGPMANLSTLEARCGICPPLVLVLFFDFPFVFDFPRPLLFGILRAWDILEPAMEPPPSVKATTGKKPRAAGAGHQDTLQTHLHI